MLRTPLSLRQKQHFYRLCWKLAAIRKLSEWTVGIEEDWHCIEGSVGRSLLLIIPDCTKVGLWKTDDLLCNIFFHWNFKGKTRKQSEQTPAVSWHSWRRHRATINKIASRCGAPRPPMTDVGTETAFRLDQRKHFRKSKHLLRSEVSWCDLHLRRSTWHCTSEWIDQHA